MHDSSQMKVNGSAPTVPIAAVTIQIAVRHAMFRSSAGQAMRRAKSDQDAVKAVMR
jgi:hypothetical protein